MNLSHLAAAISPSNNTPPSRVLDRLRKLGLLALILVFMAAPAHAQSNLLANPGFETGNITGWAASYGNYGIVTTNVHSGTFAGEVSYGSAIAQNVTGLTPNTTYTLTGWLEAQTAGQTVYLGVQNFGGTGTSKWANATTYTQLTVTFTTGATNTSANIFIYNSGSDLSYCDDLSLVSQTGGATGGTTGDATGTQAYRIADCLQRFGVNTFSQLNNNGYTWSWGGSQGSYDPTTTGLAINYITGGSGLTINDREYHRDLDAGTKLTPLQITWIHQVYSETGSPFTLSFASGGTSSDLPGMVSIVQDSVSSGLNYVQWVEGLLEPNNPYFGVIPMSTTASVQTSLYQQVHAITSKVAVAGPSIIFSLPYPDTNTSPDGSLTTNLGSYRSTILANSDLNNIHLYPPQSGNYNDGSSRGGTMADVTAAYNSVLPGHGDFISEYHPTLYSTTHPNNRTYDAYWGPIFLLSSYVDFNWKAVFWYALFNYNTTDLECGLFASSNTNPYPSANAFRALFQLTGDQGTTKSTFTPEKLNVTVSGLPPAPAGSPYGGGRWSLFENSSHQYFLMIWNEQENTSPTTTPVTVAFNSHQMAAISEYNITSGSETAVQSWTNVSTVTVNLDTSLRLLKITYGPLAPNAVAAVHRASSPPMR